MRILLALQGKGYGSNSIVSEVRLTKKYVSGGVIIDVGANKGLYSREILREYADNLMELHIFEPSKYLIDEYLEFSDKRVHVNNMALSEKSGFAKLFKITGNTGLNSLTKRRLDHFDIEMDSFEEVVTTTLDSYVEFNNIEKIDLLKLDVEGHELDVLKGATNCLLNGKIACIQFEFGGCNIDTKTYFQDFWYLLVQQYKFNIYRMTPLGLIKIKKYIETDEIFLTTNYLAVKINN